MRGGETAHAVTWLRRPAVTAGMTHASSVVLAALGVVTLATIR